MRFKITRVSVGDLIVDADRWWDARALGIVHFQCEPGDLAFESNPKGDVDVEMRWHGRPPAQQLQFRMSYDGYDGPRDWHDIGDYRMEQTRRQQWLKLAALSEEECNKETST